MAEVFPLDINDQIDEEDLSDDEFEEVSLFWMRGGDEIAYNELYSVGNCETQLSSIKSWLFCL